MNISVSSNASWPITSMCCNASGSYTSNCSAYVVPSTPPCCFMAIGKTYSQHAIHFDDTAVTLEKFNVVV